MLRGGVPASSWRNGNPRSIALRTCRAPRFPVSVFTSASSTFPTDDLFILRGSSFKEGGGSHHCSRLCCPAQRTGGRVSNQGRDRSPIGPFKLPRHKI